MLMTMTMNALYADEAYQQAQEETQEALNESLGRRMPYHDQYVQQQRRMVTNRSRAYDIPLLDPISDIPEVDGQIELVVSPWEPGEILRGPGGYVEVCGSPKPGFVNLSPLVINAATGQMVRREPLRTLSANDAREQYQSVPSRLVLRGGTVHLGETRGPVSLAIPLALAVGAWFAMRR